MRSAILLSLPIVLFFCWSLPGGEKKKFADPTPRKEAILKRCADEFVTLKPGSFVMGDDRDPATKPVHKVTFKHAFAIGKYEVTQELYYVIMGDNPAKWQGPRNSVEMVTWDDAVRFCERLTTELRKRKLIGTNATIRLPSEAEWEYACRAGTTTAFSFGDDVRDLGDYAWYKKNAPGHDPPVGVKKANPWGLFDMHGYVSEWCLDAARKNYEGAPADGRAVVDAKATERVIRGGSFADEPAVQRSFARELVPASTRNDRLGFRCVRETK